MLRKVMTGVLALGLIVGWGAFSSADAKTVFGDFLKEKGLADRHGFSEYVWGGYLLWSDLPVFIDGRVDMYGDRFFTEYLAIHDLKMDRNRISSIFRHFDVTYAIMRPQSSFSGILRMNNRWREIYRDRTASIFLALPAMLPKSPPPS